jgi:hypothetical protein
MLKNTFSQYGSLTSAKNLINHLAKMNITMSAGASETPVCSQLNCNCLSALPEHSLNPHKPASGPSSTW